MSKRAKFLVLVALVVLMLGVCVAANAENILTLPSMNGRAVMVAPPASDKDTVAVDKGYVNVYLPRGGTMNMWCWYNGDGPFSMSNGHYVNTVYMDIRSRYYRVEVTAGSSWLGVNTSYTSSGFTWHLKSKNFNENKTRTGVIRIYDDYGTAAYLRIKQCARMTIQSVYQTAKNTVDVLWKPITELNGYAVFYSSDGVNFRRWFRASPNAYGMTDASRPSNRYHYFYVRPYRTFGGRTIEGPKSLIWRVYVK